METIVESKSESPSNSSTHSVMGGYILWLFGFTGAHRFYFGRPVTGTLWFFTLGFFGIGWLIDAFLIPSMNRQAEISYVPGARDYNVAWILLTFFGYLGLHRIYIGKVWTGILWFLTGGLFMMGYLYDMWTLNGQVSQRNKMLPITPVL
ncbi:MAG: TM2 domain-containing protein [Sphingobacteriales bacterium]|nr:MAG: TM2 domain-containing protein [Sphingobacteriales bacterium]